MSQRPTGHIEEPVNSLSDLVLSEQSVDSLLGHIGRLGVAALDGWDAAATSIVEEDRVATFGLTDDRIVDVDQKQYDKESGPCVDALKTGELQYWAGAESDLRWTEFAAAAKAAGIRSVLSFPLRIAESSVGAINFYSSKLDALTDGQREEGWVFASQAAVSLANIKDFIATRQQAEQLQEGLQTRTLIGQATGLLMAQHGLTSGEAFQKLVRASQNANVKLHDIASRYVESWESQRHAGAED